MSRHIVVFVSMVTLGLALSGCLLVMVSVPSVTGLTQAAAGAVIINAKLIVGTVTTEASETVPIGCVISQNPAAGTMAVSASPVALAVSTGPVPGVAWSYLADEDTILGFTIENTSDGGVIVGGGHNAEYDMYALKLTAAGTKDWDKVYSNISPEGSHPELWRHEARGLIQTSDGGYIMLGAGNNLDDGLPGQSYLLVKTNATGGIEWSKTYAPRNPFDDNKYCSINNPYALDLTSDGGYMAVGYSYVGAYYMASILKTDAEGNLDFVKVINDNDRAYTENIVAGQQTQDGGYILCGYSDNGSPLGYLALLIKLDSDGEIEFSKTYQYVPDNHGAEAYAVTQTADGGYVLGGELINDIGKASTYGCWLAKANATGDLIWMRAYGHSMTIHYPNAIKETPHGDILAAGAESEGYMSLGKFTADGNLISNYTLPDDLPTAFANAMTLTSDGGCVLVGSGGSGTTLIAKIRHIW